MVKLEKAFDYVFLGVLILIVILGILLFTKSPAQKASCTSSNNLTCSNVFFTDSYLSFELENNQGVDFLVGMNTDNLINNSALFYNCFFLYRGEHFYNNIYLLKGNRLNVDCFIEHAVISNEFPLTFKFYYRRVIDAPNMTKVAEINLTKNDVDD
ncbi:hypothetical protein COV13_01750 [Candidatus Woesearchaeota archaeon CG10_big_fil_rev_8_21_14_0_10_32_9]|nr:MAG: hypothetical protein COV13_01750 [Candidatus Woesearchaeota archaeon CG10_big_fil_rev_8_21_14_0_10_32_9]